MKERYVDPFSPDLPIIDPKKFSGRKTEVDSVFDSLFQLKNSNPVHTIITGDRGIGKSSLLLQSRKIAEGDNSLPLFLGVSTGGLSFEYICAWHDCATGESPADLSAGILCHIESAFKSIWSKLNLEIDIAGIATISKSDSSPANLTKTVILFCNELKKVANKAKTEGKSGLILFFDEIDRVDAQSGVATFFKLSAERLAREGVNNVSFFAAGITGAIQKLEEEHGSIYRTFKDIPLPKLVENDVATIIDNGFKSVGCKYDPEVVKHIFKLSAGYPEPVHLLGSQLLKVSETDNISVKDFDLAKAQVVESLRRNKLSNMLKSAGSGKYQKILLAMAKHESPNVPLSFISNEIGYEQNQYSTNMSNLVERNIISPVDRGVYCFVDPLLKEYIARFGVINTQEEN